MEDQQAARWGNRPHTFPFFGFGPAPVPTSLIPVPFKPRVVIASQCCSCFQDCIIPVTSFTLCTAVNSPFFKFFPVKTLEFSCIPPDFLTPAVFQVLSLELDPPSPFGAHLREHRHAHSNYSTGCSMRKEESLHFSPLGEQGRLQRGAVS